MNLNYRPWTSIYALLAISLTSACAIQPAQPSDQVDSNQHLSQLADLKQWQANGKASVTNDQQSLTLTVEWQQQGDQLQVSMTGPLGQGNGQLSGSPGQYQLLGPQGEFYAANLNDFSWQLLGTDLPLDSLRWWLLGMPDPNLAYSISFNDLGLAGEITQAGWQIHYPRYQGQELPLPNRIDLKQLDSTSTGNNRARIVITQWQH